MYRRNYNKTYNYKNRNWRNSNKNRDYKNKNENRGVRDNNKLIIRRGMGPVIRQMIRDNDTMRRNYYRFHRAIREVKNGIQNIKREVHDSDAFAINRTNLKNSNNKNNKNRKELRTDKLMTPMEMVFRGQYMPLFKIEERCSTTYTYSKFVFTFYSGYPRIKILLFPYSVNFKENLYQYQETVKAGGAVCDAFFNVAIMRTNSGGSIDQGECHKTAQCGIAGNWKLLGTTYKLMNISPKMQQGGSITITKLIDNDIAPLFTYHGYAPTSGVVVDWIKNYVNADYSQVQPKNNFQPTSEIYIDEFNTSSGNNIFQGMSEYIGSRYLDIEDGFVATYSKDAVGNNIKYLIELSVPSTADQTYTLEVWNVFHVIPEPDTGLSNVARFYNNFYNSKVLQEIKTRMPMYQK